MIEDITALGIESFQIIIEICGEPDSAMGRVKNMNHCTLVVRITENDDFTKIKTVDEVLI